MEEEKEVKIKAGQPKNEKLSYEDLENVCHQLSEQSRALYQRLQEADMTNVFKRLDYLFAVVENKEAFPEEFYKNCTKEIMDILTLPEEEKEAAKAE